MSKKLYIYFKGNDEKKHHILTINNPSDTLTKDIVEGVANKIVETGAFNTDKKAFKAFEKASYVETVEKPIE